MDFKSKFNDLANASKKMASNELAIKKKQLKERSITLPLGNNILSGKVNIWQQDNGLLYLNNDIDNLFKITDFVWNGPQYKTVTKTTTKGKNKGKEKRTGRVLGAAVGTMIMPGIGTAIGAMHGSGNKKAKGKNKERSITTDEQVEVGTPAIIKLQNIVTNEITSIDFICTSKLSIKINDFMFKNSEYNEDDFDELENDNEIKSEEVKLSDPYEELKKLKELLDMGIINEEEFEMKKKELLNL